MRSQVEWPTLGLLALCYITWGVGTTWAAGIWLPLGIVISGISVALFSSLQHEALHGHPTNNETFNTLLVSLGLTLVIPYLRFRDTHLDHHRNPELTDPYDDPESNYLDPAVWQHLPRWIQALLMFNNTLLGRMLIGVIISEIAFMAGEWRAIRGRDRRVIGGWLWHIPALVPVGLWLGIVAQMPFWAYCLAAYFGLSLIKIRTFLEHQAHEKHSGRTVIIEDRGMLAFLFLNNNLHVVHHQHPKVPWYGLPALYMANRDQFVHRNGGYVYTSYAQIFRRHFLRAKDTVPHPFWH